MGSGPAVYTQPPMPSSAQVFTSGVPGAPPTIAINTDGLGQFAPMSGGIRPQRSTHTLKRSKQPFGSEQPSSDSSMRVTVTKGQ